MDCMLISSEWLRAQFNERLADGSMRSGTEDKCSKDMGTYERWMEKILAFERAERANAHKFPLEFSIRAH